MNTNYQADMQNTKPRLPLFSSPWMALFLVLRQELTQSRPAAK
jgi:hypothetical protein